MRAATHRRLSFDSEASADRTRTTRPLRKPAQRRLFFLLKSGYLDDNSSSCLRATNPLVEHLAHTISSLCDCGFGWLRAPDKSWVTQATIEAKHK